MKKIKQFILFFGAFAFIFSNLFAQTINFSVDNTEKYLTKNRISKLLDSFFIVDSTIVTLDDSTKYRYKYTFDVNGKIIEKLREHWANEKKSNFTKWLYSYNSNGNIATEIEISNGDSLKKLSYIYDSNGNVISINSTYKQEGNWGPSIAIITYAYDSNGNRLSSILGEYTRIINTYDSKNNIILSLIEKKGADNWENYKRYTYIYDKNNNVVKSSDDLWIYNTEWLSLKSYYFYNENENLTSKISDGLSVSYNQFKILYTVRASAFRTTYNYDSNGNLDLELVKSNGGNTWTNFQRKIYTYDSFNNLSVLLSEEWDNINWVSYSFSSYTFTDLYDNHYNFYGGSKIEMFYKKIITTAKTNILSEYSLSQNYPNPFNPTTTIKYALPKASNVQIVVYNSIGQEVKTLVNKNEVAGRYSVKFDGNNLVSGIYFYRITAGSFVKTKKFMLLK